MSRTDIVTDIIETARTEPYVYGSNDCFFLGLKIIDALTGSEWAKHYAGSYRTLRGAQRALRKRGHKSLVTLYAELAEPIGWGSASFGDLAVIDVEGAEHIGVHSGQAWHSITEDGPRTWPLSMTKQAFKV